MLGTACLAYVSSCKQPVHCIFGQQVNKSYCLYVCKSSMHCRHCQSHSAASINPSSKQVLPRPLCVCRHALFLYTPFAVHEQVQYVNTSMQCLMLWRSCGKASLMPLPRCCRAGNCAALSWLPSCFSCSLSAMAAAICKPEDISTTWLYKTARHGNCVAVALQQCHRQRQRDRQTRCNIPLTHCRQQL